LQQLEQAHLYSGTCSAAVEQFWPNTWFYVIITAGGHKSWQGESCFTTSFPRFSIQLAFSFVKNLYRNFHDMFVHCLAELQQNTASNCYICHK